jgi:hypothetical protein
MKINLEPTVILPLRTELTFFQLNNYKIWDFSDLSMDFWVVTLYSHVGGYEPQNQTKGLETIYIKCHFNCVNKEDYI